MARSIISTLFILTALLLAKQASASPVYADRFSVALPIPPVLQPLTTYEPSNGDAAIDFYEIKIRSFNKPIWPGLASTPMVGYNGIYPGPTIKALRGREAVVRFINQGNADAAIHLHGSATVSPFDGWASDIIHLGQYKDYYYPNFQEGRTLWYHDHAHLLTAVNVRNGQAGLYIISEEDKEAELGLPAGNYDIPLVVASKFYNLDGTLGAANNGDTIEVNGQLYPFFAVEPRKYRFRILNGAGTRTFTFQLFRGTEVTNPVVFDVIASDSGFLQAPVQTNALRTSMGERYEIVIDFEQFQGQNLTFKNSEGTALTSETLGNVLQFQVGTTVYDTDGNNVPSVLREIDFLTPPATEKTFTFSFTNNEFTINGVTFSDVNNRVLNNVPRGTIEIWNLVNDGAGVHPVHIHLVEFQILSRTIGGVTQVLPAYEVSSLKDIVILNANEQVRVLAKYSPWDGLYMFHCHNLVHEDGEMMAVFNVTALEDFGYPETTRFLDPMDARWQAQTYPNSTDIEQVRTVVLPGFNALQAYSDIDGLVKALDDYHGTR